MNGCLPNWKMEDDSKPFLCNGRDNELIKLLKRNRHAPAIFESKQTQNPESILKFGDSIVDSSNFIGEEEAAYWFQHPLDYSMEKEFSEFFYGIPTSEPISTDKSMIEDSKQSYFHPYGSVMLPPKSCLDDNAAIIKFTNHEKVGKDDLVSEKRDLCEEAYSSEAVVAMGKIQAGICGSNKAQNKVDVNHSLSNVKGVKDSLLRSTCDPSQEKTCEPAISSSSGASRRSTTNRRLKRKRRNREESEGHSEEADYESMEANKPAQQTSSCRRSRSAEVHNLSERRRRDKINEKMRALQELIPHSNKSDKASMLDEAIEYLKSLQLQLQIMWMGNGMAPMLFPSQQYLSRADIGMNHHSMTPIPNPVQLPRAPSVVSPLSGTSIPNQALVCPLQGPNSINFATQMHSSHLPQMQMPYQVMNMCTYGTQMMQQNLMVAAVDKQKHTNNKSST